MIYLSLLALVLALISAALFVRNLMLYVPPAQREAAPNPGVSVLIPARNEEKNIAAAIQSVLANHGVNLELIVADDNSEDRTAELVRQIAERDSRVRLIHTPALPAGWNGKQHACYCLAQSATKPLLCFMDADVRLRPDALARMAGFVQTSRASLVSGVPQQITGTFMERLLIPMIQFILLSYLPIDRMRRSTNPSYAAGCGQLMMCSGREYHNVGGHAAIRNTLHDGIKLPAAFRAQGLKTDLFDAARIATCRMYHNAGDVWRGLAKNATEGMATPIRLPIFTVLLLGGHVLPFAILAWTLTTNKIAIAALSAAAVALSYTPRLLGAVRFRESASSALLHPVGVLLLLAIQWYALVQHALGKPSSWKGRAYQAPQPEHVQTETTAPVLSVRP